MVSAQTQLPAIGEARMSKDIQRLGYRPQASHPLDLEVISVAELRDRAKEQLRATHRYEFHTLVCVTQGRCTQMVDFRSIDCGRGSLLVLRAGQAHSYGHQQDWDGWNVLFRPEFVLPQSTNAHEFKLALGLERLPEHMVLSQREMEIVSGLMQRMHEDTLIDAPREDVNTLLRHQVHALLTRLSILQGGRETMMSSTSPAAQRFRRFQQLVESRFSQWHRVGNYAAQLGSTEKSLARAVAVSAGMTAKAFIAARIVLEAKRLLVHTSLSVSAIAEKLGFDEPTNFSKFFRREAACSPAEFRQQHRAIN